MSICPELSGVVNVHMSIDNFVQSTDSDDPVLQEALTADGEVWMWRLTEESTECSISDKHLVKCNCSETEPIHGFLL